MYICNHLIILWIFFLKLELFYSILSELFIVLGEKNLDF